MGFKRLWWWGKDPNPAKTETRWARAALNLQSLEERTVPATFPAACLYDLGVGCAGQVMIDEHTEAGPDQVEFDLNDSRCSTHDWYWDLGFQIVAPLDGFTGDGTADFVIGGAEVRGEIFDAKEPSSILCQFLALESNFAGDVMRRPRVDFWTTLGSMPPWR